MQIMDFFHLILTGPGARWCFMYRIDRRLSPWQMPIASFCSSEKKARNLN